jgi:hypothetical protein
VKQVILKTAETKYYDVGVENYQLWHNLGFGVVAPTTVTALPTIFNPWQNIVLGSARFNRIGDKIIPRGISLKMYWANKYDRPHTMLRIIVAVLPKVFNGNVVTNAFDPLQNPNAGILGNTMLYPADHDKGVKFLYDKIHRMPTQQVATFAVQPGGAAFNKEMTKSIKLWIKPKKGGSIMFDTTSTTIVQRPIAVYCIPYEQFSTVTTDNIASVACYMRLYFKDP